MTKQEEIKEGIVERLRFYMGDSIADRVADGIILFEHENGVVIKGLPLNQFPLETSFYMVEPLINKTCNK
uniref:Uncharacterized protein n=1 Tax=viral metagenome TaxID=1070528 RepID=A0A6M3LQ73_9ZZZZ